MTKYEIIFEALQEKVNYGELTVEQAKSINDVAYNKYITEGVIKRLLSKSDKDNKAKTVLRVWAYKKELPTKEKALECITKFEKKKSINPDISMDTDVLRAMAVLNYPQSKFIKLMNKIDDGDMPKWMLSGCEFEETEIPELTKELKNIVHVNKKGPELNDIIKKFILEKSKTYGKIKYHSNNYHVYTTTPVNKVFDKAMKYWKERKMKVVCPDGFGNYLIYSIDNGKFYDYFHEQDFGENYKQWLGSGVKYNDFMKYIISVNNENKGE